MFTVKSRDCK